MHTTAVAARECETSNGDKLMRSRKGTQPDVAFNFAVAADLDKIADDRVVFHFAIVTNMRTDHEIIVIADDGLGNIGSDTTAVDGTYSLTLPVSVYDLSFSHPTHRDTVINNIAVTEGDTITVDVVMKEVTVQIPTLNEWGMLIMTLLLLAFGTVAVIRRRNAISEKACRR